MQLKNAQREADEAKKEAAAAKAELESMKRKLSQSESALVAEQNKRAKTVVSTAAPPCAGARADARRAARPKPAAAAPSSGVSPAKATEVVLAVLAAKTGYEPDMIEMDMALETELGVDSIKRVEILSDVQKELNVEAQDVAALSRTQTVGEVVEAMIKEGSAAPAPRRSPLPRRRRRRRRRAVVGRVAGEGDRGRARRARRQDGLRAGHDRDGHGARDGARRRLDQAC